MLASVLGNRKIGIVMSHNVHAVRSDDDGDDRGSDEPGRFS